MKAFKPLKKFTICIALIVLPVLIESCCGFGNGSCGCGDNDFPTAFSIKSMTVSTVNRVGLGSSSAVDPPSPGPLKNFAFVINMTAEFRTALLEGPRPTMAAFACSPPVPVGDETITSITITSNNTLTTANGRYDAGLDLAGIFFLVSEGLVTDIESIYNQDLSTTNFPLVNDQVVDVAQKHKFTIAVTLDDGRSFTGITEEAELTPN